MSHDEDFDQTDALVVLRADIDQMVAMAPEMARASKGMYDAYLQEGFTEAQALYLTVGQFKGPGAPPA